MSHCEIKQIGDYVKELTEELVEWDTHGHAAEPNCRGFTQQFRG